MINKVKGKLNDFSKRGNISGNRNNQNYDQKGCHGEKSNDSNIYDSNYTGPNNFFSNYMKDLKRAKQFNR